VEEPALSEAIEELLRLLLSHGINSAAGEVCSTAFPDDRMLIIMRRRDFQRLSLLASGSTVAAVLGFAAPDSTPAARLTIDPYRSGNRIGPDFTGLSYETGQLGDPSYFSPANTELVGLVHRLGPSGVRRIGGNTSEFSRWTPDAVAALRNDGD
jgi:hypothetical protein